MNTLELITKAYYLSGIVSRGTQVVSSEQVEDGLDILNDIIAEKSITTSFIPYFSHTEFTTIPGQAIYDIPYLVELSQLTFNQDNVRFSMTRDNQRIYFGNFRVDNIQSLPFHYYAERHINGMRIYLYFTPNQQYTVNITGKYAIQKLNLFDDLTTIFNEYYTSYLKYYASKRFCDFNGVTFPPGLMSTYLGLSAQIDKMVGTDLTVTPSTLFCNNTITWGTINLGRTGWTTIA